jgi:uncharacterized protein (TIGR02246 family)
MKKILVAALVVTVCAVVVERAAAAPVDDAIKEVLGTLDRCFAANDAACVGGVFADDATYVAPQGEAKVIKGKAQILKVLAPSMEAFNKQGGKLTHALENVRMIDDSHALIDVTITVQAPKGAGKEAEGANRESYRGVALMALQGGKWLCRDLRSYVIGHTARPPDADAKKDSAPAAAPDGDEHPTPAESAPPPAKGEPASPTQG